MTSTQETRRELVTVDTRQAAEILARKHTKKGAIRLLLLELSPQRTNELVAEAQAE